MRPLFTSLTRLRPVYDNPVEHRQAQQLLWINLIWIINILVGIPIMVWWLARVSKVNPGHWVIPLTGLVALYIIRLIQRGQLPQARWWFVGNTFIAALAAVFPAYRLDSPFIVLLAIPLVSAGVLLPRAALAGVALSLAIIVSIGGLLQISADTAPVLLGSAFESVGASIVMVLIMLSFSMIMLWYFIGSPEEAIAQRRDLDRLIADASQISRALADVADQGTELNRALEQLRDALGLYHVQVFLTDPASSRITLYASTGFIGRRLLEEDSLLTPDEKSPIRAALRQTDAVLIHDIDPAEQRRDFLPATQSELLLPLRVGSQEPFGVLDLHSAARDTFTSETIQVLTTLSHQLAALLYSARQSQNAQTYLAERDQLAGQIETDQREMARLNRQLVGATWGLYLKDRRVGSSGLDWRDGTLIAAESDSELLRQTLDDGQPRMVERGDAHILCVPIHLRGETLGAVEFRRASVSPWPDTALELAEIVAERLALSLENARLFEQAQTTAQREQLVGQVTSRLQAASDLQSLLTLAAMQFQEALGADQARVRLGPLPDDQSE
jgi:GAF domain-containing protein